MAGPYSITQTPHNHTDDSGHSIGNDENPLDKQILIKGHLSALKALLKEHNNKNLTDLIRLDFNNEPWVTKKKNLGTTWETTMMFQHTLDIAAREWFYRLPPGSIDEWAELHQKFMTRQEGKGAEKEVASNTNRVVNMIQSHHNDRKRKLRTRTKKPRAIPSTIYLMTKFPTPRVVDAKEEKIKEVKEVGLTEEIMVNLAFLDQRVNIRGNLSSEGKEWLKILLKNNQDVFAWQSSDMTVIPRQIIEHTLNANVSKQSAVRREGRAYNGRALMDFYWLISDKPELLISSFEHFSFCSAEALCVLKHSIGVSSAGLSLKDTCKLVLAIWSFAPAVVTAVTTAVFLASFKLALVGFRF
ncbi:hypothetical protein Tco_0030828 [Tanacetum coccineum]